MAASKGLQMQALATRADVSSIAPPGGPASSHGRWSVEGTVFYTTVALSACAQVSPAAQAWLQFDRSSIEVGQWWRLLTGSFVHYDWLHLAANLGAFVLLGWIALGRSRGAIWVVPLSALAVGAGVYLCAEGVSTYRGISGVDCALLTWTLIVMARQDRGWKAAAWTGLLLLMIAKSVFEAATGQILLPTSAPEGIQVVGVTHVVGMAAGALPALFIGRTSARS